MRLWIHLHIKGISTNRKKNFTCEKLNYPAPYKLPILTSGIDNQWTHLVPVEPRAVLHHAFNCHRGWKRVITQQRHFMNSPKNDSLFSIFISQSPLKPVLYFLSFINIWKSFAFMGLLNIFFAVAQTCLHLVRTRN